MTTSRADNSRRALEPLPVTRAVELAAEHLDRRPLLVVSDFDGTLSGIVEDPWAAAVLPLGRRALRRLAGMPDVHVVVLSGRTAVDVAGRIRAGNVTYLGNHGLERAYLPRGGRAESLTPTIDSDAVEAGQLAERLADELPRLVPESWLVVERKPPAVSFHYRQAPDLVRAAERVRAAVDELDPEGVLERFPGRRVVELRPAGAVAKGDALRALLDELRPRSVFLLGDDVSDALAFRVLGEARRAGETDGISVAVQARAEVPPEVAESADLVLASPAAATRFLSGLARRLSATD